MTQQKSTKRALLTSALSLLLCFSMLIGSTFAWFTDSVTSGNNRIVAGNLDVELEYATAPNGTYTSVEGKGDLFVAPEGETKGLWEPGHTEVAYLRVRNAGTLNLKYNLSVAPFSEVVGKNADGEDIRLSEILKFFATEPSETAPEAFTRATAQAKASSTDAKLNEYGKKEVALAPGASHYIAVAVYMPESVGNEANYRGDKIPEIEFALTLVATQYTVESDSFGPDYDEDATFFSTIVTNEDELVAAFANAKNGDIIGIDGTVTWTTGASHGSTPFVENASTYALRPAGNALTYVTLQGVNENATFKAVGQGVGPVGIDNATVVFKNLKIVDESVSYKESAWEFGYLEFRGTTVFENCDVVNAIMMEGDSATFKNCTFNSNKDSEYAVWVSNGTAAFENCTFTGTRGLKTHEAYGSEVVSILVNNSTFVELSKKPGMAIGDVNADTDILLTNNAFIGTQPGDQGNYKYESDTDVTTFRFVDENNSVIAKDESLPDGLYQDAEGVLYATTTDGLNAGINKADDGDTVYLAKDVVYTGNGYANITNNITLDLNGNNISTTSLGVVAKAGTIKNGTITNPVGSRAALRTWSGVSIENVTVVSPKNGGITVASGNTLPYIKNVTIEAQTYGIELQYGASVGTIENVTISAGKNGIVAQAATVGEIKNCAINGEENGVWAQLKGVYDLALNFTNSSVTGKNYGLYMCDEGATIVPDGVAYLTYDNKTVFDGGIKDTEFAFGQKDKLQINGNMVAKMIATSADLFAFANEVNANGNKYSQKLILLTSDIDLENALWTPVGQTGATQFMGVFDGQGYTISNLNIDSSTQTGGNYSSGLFGWLNRATVKNVKIDGATVKGNHNVAVIAGYLETTGCTISDCSVKNATVIATHANSEACGDKAAVIVGHAGNAGVKVENCSAEICTVTAGRDAGQIAGAAKSENVIGCTAENVTVAAGGDCTGDNINSAIIGRTL